MSPIVSGNVFDGVFLSDLPKILGPKIFGWGKLSDRKICETKRRDKHFGRFYEE